jgi:hypothetical protein
MTTSKATCRCGQPLPVPADGSDRVVCPACGARVRLRRKGAADHPANGGGGDGFVRFNCVCGRRLKVPADRADGSMAQCPDCDRPVRIPAPGTPPGPAPPRPDGGTDDFTAEQLQALQGWSDDWDTRRAKQDPDKTPIRNVPLARAADTRPAEAGFRVCPNCKTPVHLGADTCRACGTVVPRR